MEFSRKDKRRQLQFAMKPFIADLSIKLTRYFGEEKANRISCRIGWLRMRYGIELTRQNRLKSIEDLFPLDISHKRAAAIYNSYLRHYKTNYDLFYKKVVESIPIGVVIEKNLVRKLWRKQNIDIFNEYERKCIILDSENNRLLNGHLFSYY